MSGYEFSKKQNVVFIKLANAMRGFGVASGIIGVALIFSGLSLGAEGNGGFFAASRGGLGVAAVLVGIIWWSSATGFYTIARTQGSDISHLMSSLKFLSTGFMFVLAFALLRVFLQALVVVNNLLITLQ